MRFLASLPDFDENLGTQGVWQKLLERLNTVDGICYYKHPIISATTNTVPDLTILARGYQPIAIRCLYVTLDEIQSIQGDYWAINESQQPSPILELDDYRVGLDFLFQKDRELRSTYKTVSVVAFPLIAKSDFQDKFGPIELDAVALWTDLNVDNVLVECPIIGDRLWRLSRSIFQGVNPLNKDTNSTGEDTSLIGGAIRSLERDIALLDEEQHKVAIQIAPGPQRIRGLAGTGKTVVLAMKAANIHRRFPDKKILFTFNTQSLYNQAKVLISKFYRVHSDHDPNWENLHILHAWGGQSKSGVYSEACRRAGMKPWTFSYAKSVGKGDPLAIACDSLIKSRDIVAFYDYILVDEAQDFPPDFFQLLYRLCSQNKCIFWAYDELQSLSAIEVPTPTELFGLDTNGLPLINLEGEDYPGQIEKDFVLHRSYRCPMETLMLAHGIGLGIHSPRSCVQMLSNRASWESLGYEVQEGEFQEGDKMKIFRPIENSPNRIREIYRGSESILKVELFQNREAEYEWVAAAIARDVKVELVRPEQIVVISLDSQSNPHLSAIQQRLYSLEVPSIIPGLANAVSDFAEAGMVTLSTVHKAKGNEAPVVYIVAFDFLGQYVEEIEARNRAFTSISRSKGWVRITGSGKYMPTIKTEIDRILGDIPSLRFAFPNMDQIRRLDASETSRRRGEAKKVNDIYTKIKNLDPDALAALGPDQLRELLEIITSASQ